MRANPKGLRWTPKDYVGFYLQPEEPEPLNLQLDRPCVDYKVAEVLARGIVEDVKRGDVHLVRPVPWPLGRKRM